MENIFAITPVLLAAAAASLAAIASYIYKYVNRAEQQKVELRMGGIRISIEGNLSTAQANTIVKAITESHALDHREPSKDALEQKS
jgi:hypothetical protein